MRMFRRIMVIMVISVFACLMIGPRSVVYGMDRLAWSPTPMTSIEAAITAIKELKGFLYLSRGVIREINVDQFGMQIIAVEEGVKEDTKKFWIGWDRIELPNNVPYHNEFRYGITFSKVKSYSIFDFHGTSWPCVRISPYDPVSIDSWEHAHKFIDAVTTLAVAQNAVFDPYYNFMLFGDDPSAPYRKKIFAATNATAGALVSIPYQYETDPVRKLEDGDLIVQATYGEKTFPINSDKAWNDACREAVAGKAEVTFIAKVIRTGFLGLQSSLKPGYPKTMNIEIRVTNPGFGFKVMTSEPVGPSAIPPKGFGLSLQAIEAGETKMLGINITNGFMVLSVEKDSAADKMQIKPNDALLALNGVDITSAKQLQEIVTQGPIFSAKVSRAGTIVILQAPLTI